MQRIKAAMMISSGGVWTDWDGSLTLNTELPEGTTLADDTANPSAPAVASFPHVFDGTTWDRLRSGQQLAAASLPVVLTAAQLTSLTAPVLAAGSAVVGKVGIDQTTPGTTNKVYITDINAGKYETVAASQTDQAMGATGATGNYLAGVLVIPATTSPGAVSIKDGSGSAITIFTGGASSVSNLVPFFVPLGIISTGGAWKITTGTNVSAIGIGNFT